MGSVSFTFLFSLPLEFERWERSRLLRSSAVVYYVYYFFYLRNGVFESENWKWNENANENVNENENENWRTKGNDGENDENGLLFIPSPHKHTRRTITFNRTWICNDCRLVSTTLTTNDTIRKVRLPRASEAAGKTIPALITEPIALFAPIHIVVAHMLVPTISRVTIRRIAVSLISRGTGTHRSVGGHVRTVIVIVALIIITVPII